MFVKLSTPPFEQRHSSPPLRWGLPIEKAVMYHSENIQKNIKEQMGRLAMERMMKEIGSETVQSVTVECDNIIVGKTVSRRLF